MKREPCILFQWIASNTATGHTSDLLIEQLRYAGILRIVKESQDAEGNAIFILELSAPRGVDQRVWADHNAQRMQSFGLNAHASWKEIH